MSHTSISLCSLNLTPHQAIERSRTIEEHDVVEAPDRTPVDEDERHPRHPSD